ncbi:MAG TPA: tryptophan--tRNA ligase [Phycisphaerales bacterium]|nr:tryptophan--tRNA ligase [Phycisphaerales bacterium]
MSALPHTQRQRILTGDTPTGRLHLGHYVGSLENRLRLQNSGQYECYFLLANMHAFTTRADKPADIRSDTIEIVKDWLAVGIDPNRSTIVLQTEIPAIAELSWFFSMLIPFNKVMRNPTLKTEIESKGLGDTYPFGFPMYAVGQCADILAFRPALVPVGEDQVAHIEMCRDVALKFNQLYCNVGNRVPPEEHEKAGGVFPIPGALIGRIGRLVGTDGKQKMSKSLGNAIMLSDAPNDVQKKVNKIFTGRQSPTDKGDPDNALMQYLDAFMAPTEPDKAADLRKRYIAGDNLGDGVVKQELAKSINALLEPMRARRAEYEKPGGDDLVIDTIKSGTARANVIAEETLSMAKDAMKLGFWKRCLSAL